MTYKLKVDPGNKDKESKVYFMIVNNEGNTIATVPFTELIKTLEKHKYKVIKEPA